MDKINNFKEQYKYPLPEQYDLYKKMHYILDTYLENNSFQNREYICYLAATIFLVYKEYYPQFSIHLNMRTKSDTSAINNIVKEFMKFSNSKTSSPFDPLATTKDMSGFRIIFNDFNFSLPSTSKSKELYNDPKISKLRDNSNKNLNFIENVDKFLQNPIVTNSKYYYTLRQSLLKRIVDLTPKAFTKERISEPSYNDLYKIAKTDFKYLNKNDAFSVKIKDSQLVELADLLNDLRSRLYDPLQFAILEKTIPIVFEHPLIKNCLQTTLKFDKHNQKPNGFEALYYNIFSPFGHVQELQAQSNKAFYTATKGSAYHSGMDGKYIDIEYFFELVNPNDKHKLSYYLKALDNISADSLISIYELPKFKNNKEKEDFFKTNIGKQYLESSKYYEMMKHIKIKDQIKILPERPPEKDYIAKQHEESNPKKIEEIYEKRKSSIMNTDEYLLSLALALSPYMDVCSAGHTSFTTASLHHKKIIGEFSEVLRKKDSNTVLRDILIRRLEIIIDNITSLDNDSQQKLSPLMKHNLQIIKTHDEMTNRLPKDVSQKNITGYGARLRDLTKHKNEEELKLDLVI